MAHVTESRKACAVNPLKMSQPLGAAYAFMGLASCMPVMHGSQGCTSFGLVVLVRHFKEAIPLQTTAMNEASTVMGGYDNIEKAVLNIRQRAKPELIAICSTGLTETRGDDVEGHLKLVRQRHPALDDPVTGTEIVYVSTPDYIGAFQDGWARAVTALVSQVPHVTVPRQAGRIIVLPGSHLTPGDIEELRDMIEAFGLKPRSSCPICLARWMGTSPTAGWAQRLAARRWLHCATWARQSTRWPWASRCGPLHWRCRRAAACRTRCSTGLQA